MKNRTGRRFPGVRRPAVAPRNAERGFPLRLVGEADSPFGRSAKVVSRRYAGALGRVRPPLRRGIAAVASRGGIRPSDRRKRHRYVGVRLPERFAESCPDPARLSGKSYECYDCIVVIQVVYLRVNCCRDSIIGVYPFVKYQYGITVFFNACSYFVQ